MAESVEAGGMHVEPVVLEGQLVRLEPMTSAHLPHLEKIAFAPELWEYGMPSRIRTESHRLFVSGQRVSIPGKDRVADRHPGAELTYESVI